METFVTVWWAAMLLLAVVGFAALVAMLLGMVFKLWSDDL